VKIDSSVPRTLDNPTNGVDFEEEDFEKIEGTGQIFVHLPGPALHSTLSGLRHEIVWYEEGNRKDGDSDEDRQRKFENALLTYQAAYIAVASRGLTQMLTSLFGDKIPEGLLSPSAEKTAESATPVGMYI